MQAHLEILFALLLTVTTASPAQSPKPNEGANPPPRRASPPGSPASPPSLPSPPAASSNLAPSPSKTSPAKSGLATFHHQMGTPDKNYILDSVGSGVALLDYDNDGWLDIYLVNGSTYEAMSGKSPSPTPPSSTTITTEPSPTSPPKPGLPTTAGASVPPSPTTTTTASRPLRHQLRQEPPLPQQPRRHLHRRSREGRRSPSATGPPEPPGGTTTATANSICSSLAMSTMTWSTPPRNSRRGHHVAFSFCSYPRHPHHVRPAWPSRRAGSPVPQQR